MDYQEKIREIRARHLKRLDDDSGWITLENGNHVLIENGNMTIGPASLRGSDFEDANSTPSRYGSGGKTVANTYGHESLRTHMQDKYNIKINKSVKELDYGLVKEVCGHVEKILDEYPELANTMEEITVSSGKGVMATNGGVFYLDKKDFSDPDYLQRKTDHFVKNGYWTPNTTIGAMVHHEMGHARERQLYSDKAELLFKWGKHSKAEEIVNKACDNLRKKGYNYSNKEFLQDICKHAEREGNAEAFADAYQDVYANGKNASVLSDEIVRLTEKELNNLGRGKRK